MSGAQDLFWLARYAYNTIQPLIDKINERDPDLKARLAMDINFNGSTVLSNSVHVNVFAEPRGVLAIVASTGYATRNKAGMDAVAKKLEETYLPAKVLEPVS